jgi:hypothetical protein
MRVSGYFNDRKWPQFTVNIVNVACTPIVFSEIAIVSTTFAVYKQKNRLSLFLALSYGLKSVKEAQDLEKIIIWGDYGNLTHDLLHPNQDSYH